MKDAILITYQGSWVARISLHNGKSTAFSLLEALKDEDAHSINTLDEQSRIRQIMPLVRYPLVIDEDTRFSLLNQSDAPF
jgi:2-methylisocitrate lyase-like PEP mutase family enzyme